MALRQKLVSSISPRFIISPRSGIGHENRMSYRIPQIGREHLPGEFPDHPFDGNHFARARKVLKIIRNDVVSERESLAERIRLFANL